MFQKLEQVLRRRLVLFFVHAARTTCLSREITVEIYLCYRGFGLSSVPARLPKSDMLKPTMLVHPTHDRMTLLICAKVYKAKLAPWQLKYFRTQWQGTSYQALSSGVLLQVCLSLY